MEVHSSQHTAEFYPYLTIHVPYRLRKLPWEVIEYLEYRHSKGRLGCPFGDSPLVTVTVGDGEEVGVEDSIINRKSRDDLQAVVMLTAADICALKHPCAQVGVDSITCETTPRKEESLQAEITYQI